MPFQHHWESINRDIPLMLEVQYFSVPVSGLVPTVEVYKFDNHNIANWDDLVFLPSSSGIFSTTMSGVPSNHGLYTRLFSPLDFGQNNKRQTYYVRYKATIPSGMQINENIISEDINISATEIHSFDGVPVLDFNFVE